MTTKAKGLAARTLFKEKNLRDALNVCNRVPDNSFVRSHVYANDQKSDANLFALPTDFSLFPQLISSPCLLTLEDNRRKTCLFIDRFPWLCWLRAV